MSSWSLAFDISNETLARQYFEPQRCRASSVPAMEPSNKEAGGGVLCETRTLKSLNRQHYQEAWTLMALKYFTCVRPRVTSILFGEMLQQISADGTQIEILPPTKLRKIWSNIKTIGKIDPGDRSIRGGYTWFPSQHHSTPLHSWDCNSA